MSAERETVRTAVEDGVLTLTLHRPERMNAFTEQMRDDVVAVLDEADADDSIRAIVVTGAGKAFCAGADLEAGGDAFQRDAGAKLPRDGGGVIGLRMFSCLKPIIGAINGAAVGVGATMTLPMDVRLASTGARMGFVFARRGITPEACSSFFLPRVVGISRAMEWVATGRVFDAQEALDSGLVRSLHEPDDLLGAAHELAREIADNTAPVSVALSRQLMWRMLGAGHPMEAHQAESRALYSRARAEDVREGVGAFLEKRRATFPNSVATDLPDIFPAWAEPGFDDTL